jgi:hypothetical protein
MGDSIDIGFALFNLLSDTLGRLYIFSSYLPCFLLNWMDKDNFSIRTIVKEQSSLSISPKLKNPIFERSRNRSSATVSKFLQNV